MSINPVRILCKNNALLRYGAGRRISDKAYEKFKLKQARMQCNDDQPVFLKKGIPDKIVYSTITTVIMASILVNCRCIYQRIRGNY